VEEQLIRYVHDGSETQTDAFVLLANASEMDRQSQPVAFTITILPVNDQPPVLTTNTGLQVSSLLNLSHLWSQKETRVPSLWLSVILCEMGSLPQTWKERCDTVLKTKRSCEVLLLGSLGLERPSLTLPVLGPTCSQKGFPSCLRPKIPKEMYYKSCIVGCRLGARGSQQIKITTKLPYI
jgi:hypothetical protein